MSEWEAMVPCLRCSLPALRLAAATMLAVLSSNNRIVSPLIEQQFGDIHKSPPDRLWILGH